MENLVINTALIGTICFMVTFLFLKPTRLVKGNQPRFTHGFSFEKLKGIVLSIVLFCFLSLIQLNVVVENSFVLAGCFLLNFLVIIRLIKSFNDR